MAKRRACATLVGAILLWAVATSGWAAGDAAPDYPKLRAARAASLTRPDGWFSLVALNWIRDGDTTVGRDPGSTVKLEHVPERLLTLHKAGDTVTLTTVSDGLVLAGVPAKPGAVLGADEDNAHALQYGQVLLWVIDRGGRRYLRVKDAAAPARVQFHGLRWYPPAPQYRVTAEWVPYPTKHTLAVTNKLGQVTQEPVPGYARFRLGGKSLSLVPMLEDGRLFIVFNDTTGRLETDGGGRFLTGDAPSNGFDKPGTVELDFNQAVNPPCAYSPYATCPLAPRENRLPVAVAAGEKRYDE